jgi:hypothetical protein
MESSAWELRARLATPRAWPLALFAGGHEPGNGLPVVNGQNGHASASARRVRPVVKWSSIGKSTARGYGRSRRAAPVVKWSMVILEKKLWETTARPSDGQSLTLLIYINKKTFVGSKLTIPTTASISSAITIPCNGHSLAPFRPPFRPPYHASVIARDHYVISQALTLMDYQSIKAI